jgi:hypothetical protein
MSTLSSLLPHEINMNTSAKRAKVLNIIIVVKDHKVKLKN